MEPRLETPYLGTYRDVRPSVESGEQLKRPNRAVGPADDAHTGISEATVENITPVRWPGPLGIFGTRDFNRGCDNQPRLPDQGPPRTRS